MENPAPDTQLMQYSLSTAWPPHTFLVPQSITFTPKHFWLLLESHWAVI